MRLKRIHPATVIATGALAVALGGVAYATIPDGNGTIHGCYDTQDGALRIIDPSSQTCPAGQAAISWNQTGPAGAAGGIGPAGPPGGDANVNVHELSDAGPYTLTTRQAIAALALPAGSYTVNTTFTLDNVSGIGWGVCQLWIGPGDPPPPLGTDATFNTGSDDVDVFTLSAGAVQRDTMQVEGALSSGGAVHLLCAATSDATIGTIRIVATGVNQVIHETGTVATVHGPVVHVPAQISGLTTGESRLVKNGLAGTTAHKH
jgi:hypothetical protein